MDFDATSQKFFDKPSNMGLYVMPSKQCIAKADFDLASYVNTSGQEGIEVLDHLKLQGNVWDAEAYIEVKVKCSIVDALPQSPEKKPVQQMSRTPPRRPNPVPDLPTVEETFEEQQSHNALEEEHIAKQRDNAKQLAKVALVLQMLVEKTQRKDRELQAIKEENRAQSKEILQ